MTIRVEDNTQRNRFEIHVDGEVAGFADYLRRGETVYFTHAEVDADHEGRGLGSRLASESLDAMRAAGVAVVPACPFYAEFIGQHREYVALVPQQRRDEFDLQ